MLQFEMEIPGREKFLVSALVDTGAEINRVRRNLVPPEVFRESKNPIQFMAANQTLVPGGRQELESLLWVQGVDPDLGTPSSLKFPIVCYDADIGVDLILSYEWMASNKMDVIPRKHGVAVHQDGAMLWVAGRMEAQPYEMPFASVCTLNTHFSEDFYVQSEYFAEIMRQFGIFSYRGCFW